MAPGEARAVGELLEEMGDVSLRSRKIISDAAATVRREGSARPACPREVANLAAFTAAPQP